MPRVFFSCSRGLETGRLGGNRRQNSWCFGAGTMRAGCADPADTCWGPGGKIRQGTRCRGNVATHQRLCHFSLKRTFRGPGVVEWEEQTNGGWNGKPEQVTRATAPCRRRGQSCRRLPQSVPLSAEPQRLGPAPRILRTRYGVALVAQRSPTTLGCLSARLFVASDDASCSSVHGDPTVRFPGAAAMH